MRKHVSQKEGGVLPDRTELEWAYTPTDFFETAYSCSSGDFELAFAGGTATATLCVPQDPVPPRIERRAHDHIVAVLGVRQLQIHKPYTLQRNPSIHQYRGDEIGVTVRVATSRLVISCTPPDLVVRDADGIVTGDTKAERTARDRALLDAVAPVIADSPVALSLLSSYAAAVSDPANELVHLYEVRDALAAHFGSEPRARAALAIPKKEWQRLGMLADREPLSEGRHRGRHTGMLRGATLEELSQARSIVMRWIIAFAKLPSG